MYLVVFELEKVAVLSVIAGFVKHRYFSCVNLAKNSAHRDYYVTRMYSYMIVKEVS